MILIVIPARLGSTRLQRKALANIQNKPMIQWTYEKAQKSKFANEIIVATDSEEIKEVVENFGGKCIMTSENCQSGTERAFEVSQKFPEAEIIVNLQGDEPMMPIEILDGTIQEFINLDSKIRQIGTAVVPFQKEEDRLIPSFVKAVFNKSNKALYFSRANLANAMLHVGLYVYTKQALKEFCSLEQSPLEKAEKLEQLRAIENNINIHVYKSNYSKPHFGIDTAEDLAKANELISNNF